MNRLSISFMVAILLSSVYVESRAARRVKLEPAEMSGQVQVVWSGGTPSVVSDVVDAEGLGTRLILSPASPEYDRNQRVSFYLWVANYTEETFEIGTSNLLAANLAGDELQIVDAEQARKEIRSSAARTQFAQALAAGLRAYGSSYTASASGVNPYQVQQDQRTDQLMSQIQQQTIQDRAEATLELTDLYFGRTTVFPGASYIGFVDVFPPNKRGNADNVELTIQAGPNTHVVLFDYLELD